MNDLNINSADTLIISIFVLFLGHVLTRRVGFLEKYSIPQAVTGGLIVSLVVLAIVMFDVPKIIFDLRLRDLLLLAFFDITKL